jgi:hypothetical protein
MILRQKLVPSGEFVRLGVALEVRAPRNHDAVAIERTITPSDPPTTSPPFDDRNTVKMVSECPDPNCARWKVSAAGGMCWKAGKSEG